MKRIGAVIALVAVLGVVSPAHAGEYTSDYWDPWIPWYKSEFQMIGSNARWLWDINPGLAIMVVPTTATLRAATIVAVTPAVVVNGMIWSMGWVVRQFSEEENS